MNIFTNSLTKKLWLVITATIVVTILYSFSLSYFFYEMLYVENVEVSLLDEGSKLADDYEGGPLTEELKDKINWYSTKTDSEIFIVNNPRELSACLPFEIDYETLINSEERDELLKGNPVKKIGYEERFDRKIMAVIFPLVDENRLEGIIYLYVPLVKISEVMTDFTYLWLVDALLFLIIAIFIGTIIVRKLTQPLVAMKHAAGRVSMGDYSVSITYNSKDEIGDLVDAFNHMSESIRKEDERKKEFLADVSHELRTPISYVKGYSEALVTGMVKSEEDCSNYLHLIHREAGRMERLVGDLLDLSKLDTEEYRLEKMPLPLAQLIEDSLQIYLKTFMDKNLTLSFELDPDIIINGDEGRIEQVLQNIINNSLQYTETGGVAISLYKLENDCCIEIKDSGSGIPQTDLQKIKQRFYRVNKARTRKDGGSGLGLAIAEKLVTLHGGTLSISSEVGVGTTVRITFPMINFE